jgi:hypothetical protein
MLVPFEKLDPNSRIWIYQSGKKLTKEDRKFITQKTQSFLIEWTAHGHSLEAAMQILYDQFLIIGVNEAVNEASGCSIDKSVNHIRQLERELNIDLLERSKVAIRDKAKVVLVGFSEIKQMVSNGVISKETEIFNNAIVTKKELESSWLLPAQNSWIKRYF